MANFKYQEFLTKSNNSAFDTISEPGHTAPHSGIYRCEGCGENAVSTRGHTLPPQNHHQHTAAQGQIRWRLIAATH
ncbi:protein L [Paraburkholderia sediminicola]|nr:protein L [Paraburkholderia sediminicola]